MLWHGLLPLLVVLVYPYSLVLRPITGSLRAGLWALLIAGTMFLAWQNVPWAIAYVGGLGVVWGADAVIEWFGAQVWECQVMEASLLGWATMLSLARLTNPRLLGPDLLLWHLSAEGTALLGAYLALLGWRQYERRKLSLPPPTALTRTPPTLTR